VDKVSVNQAVKAGIRAIPGIHIHEIESTVVKA